MTASPPARPKGHQPVYFDDPAIDQLHAALLSMATELAVALDRIDTLERLLERHAGVTRDQIEGFVPDAAVATERAARHADLATRLLKPFRDYRESLLERAAATTTPPATDRTAG
jgi:hypothetical protein